MYFIYTIYIQEVFRRPPQHTQANKIAKDFCRIGSIKVILELYGGLRSYKSVRRKSGLRYGQAESNHVAVLYTTSQ